MPAKTLTAVSPPTLHRIAELLGREPRGLEEVAVFGPAGEPVVIRVASLVDDAPFPNLFWLLDPVLVYRIDTEEAAGLIHVLQRRVDGSAALRRRMSRDHKAHIALRNSFMSAPVESRLRAAGYYDVLQRRGIGGIADFSRVRCLHTWYAAHLVVPNTIGAMLEAYWGVSVEGTAGD